MIKPGTLLISSCSLTLYKDRFYHEKVVELLPNSIFMCLEERNTFGYIEYQILWGNKMGHIAPVKIEMDSIREIV